VDAVVAPGMTQRTVLCGGKNQHLFRGTHEETKLCLVRQLEGNRKVGDGGEVLGRITLLPGVKFRSLAMPRTRKKGFYGAGGIGN